METNQIEKINKQELENIKAKMCFYDITDGYIGLNKGRVELFLMPCFKANSFITLSRIQDLLDKYDNGGL